MLLIHVVNEIFNYRIRIKERKIHERILSYKEKTIETK